MSTSDVLAEFIANNKTCTVDYTVQSKRMRELLDIDYTDWCGFAAWSSYTIGGVFEPDSRKQLPATRRMFTSLARRVSGPAAAVPMAIGNLQIYVEMSRVYDELIGELQARESPNPTAVARKVVHRVLATTPQDPSREPFTADQRKHLRLGAEAYANAYLALYPQEKAEWVFAGGCWFSAFEQSRADALIDEYVYGPTRRLRRWLPGRMGDPDEVTALDRRAARLLTRFGTLLITGQGIVQLGAPLVPPRHYRNGNPLDHLSIPEAREAFDRFSTERFPAATYWPDWEDRMAVIVAYFRAYQHADQMVDNELLTDGTVCTEDHQTRFIRMARRYRRSFGRIL